MSLTAEQSAELASDEPSADPTENTDAPASGEQPTTEQQTETSNEAVEQSEGDKSEAEEGKPKEGEQEQPKPEAQRAWRQVEAAKKEQVKVARARQALEQDVQRVRAYESQLDTRAADLDARESRLKPLEDALRNHDLQALVDLGFDYDGFTRSRLDANTPEGIARRALEENKKLREQLEADKKAAEERDKAQRQIAEMRHVATTLVQLVEDDPTDYPDLYAWAPEKIAEEGILTRDAFFRANKRMPNYGEVLTILQKRAKGDADVRTQRTSALQQRKSANPSDAGSAGKVDAKGASGSPGTPALTGRTAAERPSPPREKTEEEIDEECRAMLRGLRR